MNQIFVIPLGIMLAVGVFAGCRKSKSKPSSEWFVDGNHYSSNNVTYDLGGAFRVDLYTLGGWDAEGFRFVFYTDGVLPTHGQYLLQCGIESASYTCPTINHNKNPYFIRSPYTHYAKASEENGKTIITLDSTWFHKYDDYNDSIIVTGTFRQP